MTQNICRLNEKINAEIDRRIGFYYHLLKVKDSVYINQIGIENLNERLIYAILNCLILKKRYTHIQIDNKDTICQQLRLCICGKASKPYVSSCILYDCALIPKTINILRGREVISLTRMIHVICN